MPSGEYLEICRKKVVDLAYKPTHSIPPQYSTRPSIPRNQKGHHRVQKIHPRPSGPLDLILSYVERGHAFANDFGDIDMPFYDSLCNMLGKFSKGLRSHPTAGYIYHDLFRARLLKMNRTAGIGLWLWRFYP